MPEVQYAKSGDVNIAYLVWGQGPFDIVWVPGWFSNVELLAEDPPRGPRARAEQVFFRRLASAARLILFDKRGTGASDRVSGVANLETRMDDVRAVMDAVGSQRAAIAGISEGGPMSLLFAATYPERTAALVLYGTTPRFTWAPDWPWGEPMEAYWREVEREARLWGTEEGAKEVLREAGEPLTAEDVKQLASWQRLSASPGDVITLERMNSEIDVRHVFPVIRVPTLVLHRIGEPYPIEAARWMAEQITGARFVELPGTVHNPFFGDTESVLGEIETFTTGIYQDGAWEAPEPDRVLATVLFTDIVGSTEQAVELGDRRWRELLQEHHAGVRRQLARFRGREIDTAGDGFFATFDGPARAVRCACAIVETVRDLGLNVRAGLHTGECETLDGKVGGIAVHIGARVAAEAAGGEVLVSGTVKDLVAGSGLAFDDRGARQLKGMPGEWRLYSVRM
jgi:class 3 adenylate cyclase/pimeloyl-ACP methyl ester carboxylesterase